jgi:hypothetical protein
MAIMNRRNAVLGWAVWEISKRVAKQKAKAVAPAVEADKKRPTKTAIVATAAAIGGLVVFWRKRTSEDEFPPV